MENNPEPVQSSLNRKIKAIILDDEISAVRGLQQMIELYCPSIQIVSATVSVNEALNAVKKCKPDVVFLDIEMPPVHSGFDFLKQCPHAEFDVVIVTAYPQYAIQAINTIHPLAYLVKPFTVGQLVSAADIVIEKVIEKERSLLSAAGNSGILINDSRRGKLVILSRDILFCKAEGSFTDFYFQANGRTNKITASGYLGAFESQLPDKLFYRTHHSYLVNLSHITRVERKSRNARIIFADPQMTAEVSVSKMDNFNKKLEAYHQLCRFEGKTV